MIDETAAGRAASTASHCDSKSCARAWPPSSTSSGGPQRSRKARRGASIDSSLAGLSSGAPAIGDRNPRLRRKDAARHRANLGFDYLGWRTQVEHEPTRLRTLPKVVDPCGDGRGRHVDRTAGSEAAGARDRRGERGRAGARHRRHEDGPGQRVRVAEGARTPQCGCHALDDWAALRQCVSRLRS
eukprot:3391499-Prymnesium_polylepis.2